MTFGARRAAARTTSFVLASLGLSLHASAAPSVSPPRVLVESTTPLEHALATEALVGNGTDVFGAFVQGLGGNRSVLRGTYFGTAANVLTPETPTGLLVSGSLTRDTTAAGASRRPALAMNGLGTVLGVYANDTFRVGRNGAIRSLALTRKGLPAAPLFPTVGGAQAAVLVGDPTAGAGSFLLVTCAGNECTMQRLGDDGAPLGAEASLFTFNSGDAPPMVAATYVPGQGFRVVAAQKQQILTAVVTADAVVSPAALEGTLAPACAGWAATSVRVGRGATPDTAQTRVTTTCDTDSAAWVTFEGLTVRTDMLCAAAAGVDDCLFTSSDAGLFVATGATLTSVATATVQTLPTWSAPLRVAPGPGGALAVAANDLGLSHFVPESLPTAASPAWRTLVGNSALYSLEGEATPTGEGPTFRAGVSRGVEQAVLRGDGSLLVFPEEIAAAPLGVTLLGESTFAATSANLVRLSAGADGGGADIAPVAFTSLIGLSHGGQQMLGLGLYPGGFLYSYALDPAAFGPPTGGALPGLPAVAKKASLISPTEANAAVDLAFDGNQYLVAFTRASHLDGALLALDGSLVSGPFPISSSLYAQGLPQVIALAGGGFFVTWNDARTSLLQNDIYGTFVGANGAVESPEGIRIASSPLHEVRPYAATTSDPDHVLVIWSEYPEDDPRTALRVRGAAVSRSTRRARASFSIEAGTGDHFAVGMLPAGPTGVMAYYGEAGSPSGGERVLARFLGTGKATGESCAADAECTTDVCAQGKCGEPPLPPGSSCSDPCAVLDVAANTCVPVPRGTLPSNASCPGYVCNGTQPTCPTRCQSNADCTNDAECENQACVVVRSCTSETELSDRGAVRSCGSFRCDPVLAACFTRCDSKEQCANGLVCDELGGCVPAPAAAEGGCSMQDTPGSGFSWLAVGAAMLGLVVVRRKKWLAPLGMLALFTLAPRAAHAADPRVGPSEPLPVVPGTSFAPVAAPDAAAMVPLALPGATATTLFRMSDRGGSYRDAVLGASGFTSFQPAVGGMNGRASCEDGSVLAIDRVTVAGRPQAWLAHYTNGPIPTHRIRVPDTTSNSGTCTSDGAWIVSTEATDVYERYVWATGARAQRIETPDLGTTPFFTDTTAGWVATRAGVVTVLDASRAEISSFTPYTGNRPAVIFSTGARAILSFDVAVPEVGIIPYVGVASVSAAAVTYTQAPDAALPAPTGGTLVSRDGSLLVVMRSGAQVWQLRLPESLVPIDRQTATFMFPPGNSSAILRAERYELSFEDGTRHELALADLSEVAPPQIPVTAVPRALRLASSSGNVTRLLGYHDAALALFRPGSPTVRTLTLPEGTEAQTPADLQGLPDGRASLTTRDATTFAGHVLSPTDDLAPFPLLDAATSVANLGDGLAAVHFVDNAGTARFTIRHISATVGETTRVVDVPRPVLEWGLRTTSSVAPIGNVAFAVYARGVGSGEQHLDWARIEQGTVSEPKPLTRAFLKQQNPKIACDPRGQRGCLVAWEDYRKSAYDADVYIARILPDGSTPDGDGLRLATSNHQEGEPSVLWTDDDDHFFVAWRDADPTEDRKPGVDPSRIRGAFVRHDGTIEDPEGIDLSDEPMDEMAPILLPGARGTFQLAYQVFSSAADVASNQIALRTIRAGKLRGETCGADGECSGRACIDGVCCEAICRDGCGSCNQPGQLGICVPRPDGAPSYQDRCGSYLCDGTVTNCPAVCRSNDDCTGSSTCDPATRQCTGADGSACQDDATEVDDAGAATSCAPYRCLRGRCASRCQSNAECMAGGVCTPSGRCEPAPPPAEGGCSTTATGANSTDSPLGLGSALAGALVGLALVKRARLKRARRKSGAVPS